MQIHSVSALAGAGLLGLVLVAAGAVQVPAPLQQIPTGQGLVRVAGIPDPRQMLVIREGTPYVVPPGKLLVVTGLGPSDHIGGGYWTRLLIDGQVEAATSDDVDAGSTGSVRSLPPGLTVAAGAVISVDDSVNGQRGRAWGYLVDA